MHAAAVSIRPLVIVGGCGLTTLAFNMLPVGCLDGGRDVQRKIDILMISLQSHRPQKSIVVAKMAQLHIVKAFLFAVVLAVFSVAATAQDIGSAPTSSPDPGAAFSLSISFAVIGTSPLVSVAALIKH
nr:putative zinc metalloprotease EGY1 chloroplastic [Ipomoea batatas]